MAISHTPCSICSNLDFKPSSADTKNPECQVEHIKVAELYEESLRYEPCPSCSLLWHCISEVAGPDLPHPDLTFSHLVIDPEGHGDRLGKGPLTAQLIPDPRFNQGPVKRVPVDLQFYTLFGGLRFILVNVYQLYLERLFVQAVESSKELTVLQLLNRRGPLSLASNRPRLPHL